MSTGSGDERDEEEWRFSLEDLPDADDTPAESIDERDTEETDGTNNIAGTLETRQPLEPGDIDLENAFFVALGVLIVVGLIVGAMLGL